MSENAALRLYALYWANCEVYVRVWRDSVTEL